MEFAAAVLCQISIVSLLPFSESWYWYWNRCPTAPA